MDNSNESKKILIVEDEHEIRLNLKNLLKAKGYIVDDTNSPLIAMEKIKKERYQVIITDNRMPGVRGVNLVEAFKKSGAKVILMSGSLTPEEVLTAKKGGVDQVFVKPFSLMSLDQAIFELFYHDDPIVNPQNNAS